MNKQNKSPNKKGLNSRERQVQKTLDKIEKWHLWRYKEALKYVTNNDEILDLGMGCGYGSYVLSEKSKKVTGIDDSQDAVDYARKYWLRKNIEYQYKDVFEVDGKYDITVAFEIIEHVRDVKDLFKKLGKVTKNLLLLSAPHASRIIKKTANFHWKHFTEEEIINYLTDIGFRVERIETVMYKNGLDIFCVARRKLNED